MDSGEEAALAAILGIGGLLFTFAAFAFTTGLFSVPTIACVAVGTVGLTADYIAGRRQAMPPPEPD